MAITNGYTTLARLKARLGITDTTEDAALESLVEAVSRAIDDFCGRRFYAATQTRYYTANRSDRLLVDDLLSITTLKTDDDADGTFETTWTASDYLLAPYNAQQESQPQPYWRIESAPSGSYSFPVCVPRGVQIAGSWGFASTTPDVVEN
ncbi:MAG: phage head-tail connector protein, partial [Chloroflexi bacterium]|nr:phage head-tail connector protein [Chloroflexota bacterium]